MKAENVTGVASKPDLKITDSGMMATHGVVPGGTVGGGVVVLCCVVLWFEV